MLRLRRTIIAEAEHFPELARAWYDNGPARAHRNLAAEFAALDQRGLLRVADPALAAEHFNWLIVSIPLNQAMFHGADLELTSAQLKRYADEAVRVFLAAYAPDAHHRRPQ